MPSSSPHGLRPLDRRLWQMAVGIVCERLEERDHRGLAQDGADKLAQAGVVGKPSLRTVAFEGVSRAGAFNTCEVNQVPVRATAYRASRC